MTKIILITWHYYGSKRRAGFHWLADSFWANGANVTFLTIPMSGLSRLRRDERLQYPVLREANMVVTIRDRLTSFVWYTSWHPVSLRSKVLNNLSRPIFKRYGALSLGLIEEHIKSADMFVFENGPGLMLFDRFKALNPKARFVYRVSDDLRVLGSHPLVWETEERIAPQFDLVSLPSPHLASKFADQLNLQVQAQGVPKGIFDEDSLPPFANTGKVNAVSIGSTLFDKKFVELAQNVEPDWTFHIIGNVPRTAKNGNVIYYGEMPFADVVPYVKHADVGLALYSGNDAARYLTHSSNKLIQYSYCRLPIVAPYFAAEGRSHAYGYQPGDRESIRLALRAALNHDRDEIATADISGWDDLANAIVAH